MTPNKERAEFLHGLRTLTAAELREWAAELYPFAAPPALPAGMSEDEPLMVSVVPGSPDRRGLSGASVL